MGECSQRHSARGELVLLTPHAGEDKVLLRAQGLQLFLTLRRALFRFRLMPLPVAPELQSSSLSRNP